ncbi:MAG: hypothetical protein U0263_17365 [Polyangiaceae bacterium]
MLGPTEDDLFFLDREEQGLVLESLAAIQPVLPGEAEILASTLHRLRRAAELVAKSPSIFASWESRRQTSHTGEPLLDLLCEVPEWDLDLHVPMRVIFGRAYLVAKINFLKGLSYGLEEVHAPDTLRTRGEQELGQSIYSKLAEELFTSIVTDPGADRRVKLAAARSLLIVWEDRLTTEIDDFAPVLESVWEARNKVRPVIGTTLGTHEFFRLLRECRDTRFLEYFEGDVPDEQLQAFEEFLLGLSYEQLSELRDHMRTEGIGSVSADQAQAKAPPSWAPHATGPQALYTSYKKRKVKAQYRVMTSAPGPHKTAEEFVMTAFLLRDGG